MILQRNEHTQNWCMRKRRVKNERTRRDRKQKEGAGCLKEEEETGREAVSKNKNNEIYSF